MVNDNFSETAYFTRALSIIQSFFILYKKIIICYLSSFLIFLLIP